MTISSTVGTISKIVFTCTANKGATYYGPDNLSIAAGGVGTYSTANNSKDGTWRGNTDNPVSTISFGTTAQCRATKIVVTVIDPPAAPTFSVVGHSFTDSFDLTITGPEGCSLRWTTDGSDPKGADAKTVLQNTKTISIPAATTTVRAVASKSGTTGEETSATYTYMPKTIVTINDAALTNTDVYKSNIGGFLRASIADEYEQGVDGNVAWSSSNKAVATIGSDGSVTLIGAGTSTITASYAGQTDTYQADSETYNLTVTDSNPNAVGSLANVYTVSKARAKIDVDKSLTTAGVYVEGVVHSVVDDPTDLANGMLSFDLTDDGTTTLRCHQAKNKGNAGFTAATDIAVGQKVVVTGTLTYDNVNARYEVTDDHLVSSMNPVKEVGTDGWATYITTDNLQFEQEQAFVVSSVGTDVVLRTVTEVPTGTPLILKGEGQKFAALLGTAPAEVTNSLRVSNGSDHGTTNDYVLGTKEGVAGFYLRSGTALTEGRVYLPADAVSTEAHYLGFSFEEEPSAIKDLTPASSKDDGVYYDLMGRKVKNPANGLYIVNGKKILR